MAELKLHQDLEHFSLLGAKKAREKDKASKKVTVGGFGGIDPDVLKSLIEVTAQATLAATKQQYIAGGDGAAAAASTTSSLDHTQSFVEAILKKISSSSTSSSSKQGTTEWNRLDVKIQRTLSDFFAKPEVMSGLDTYRLMSEDEFKEHMATSTELYDKPPGEIEGVLILSRFKSNSNGLKSKSTINRLKGKGNLSE